MKPIVLLPPNFQQCIAREPHNDQDRVNHCIKYVTIV